MKHYIKPSINVFYSEICDIITNSELAENMYADDPYQEIPPSWGDILISQIKTYSCGVSKHHKSTYKEAIVKKRLFIYAITRGKRKRKFPKKWAFPKPKYPVQKKTPQRKLS